MRTDLPNERSLISDTCTKPTSLQLSINRYCIVAVRGGRENIALSPPRRFC
jgi:hypothetical protein